MAITEPNVTFDSTNYKFLIVDEVDSKIYQLKMISGVATWVDTGEVAT